MEVYVKKYFWLVPVFAIGLSAYFGATAVNHIIDSRSLTDANLVAAEPEPMKVAPKVRQVKSKDGNVIATRNMFCSTCLPIEVEEEVAGVSSSDSPPITSLPLRLVATNVSSESVHSFATIQNTSSDRQGSYSIDQMIPGGGPIVRISAQYVDFENSSKKRVERISLLSTSSRAPKVVKAPVKVASSSGDELDSGINKLSATTFELDRKMVDKILEDPSSVIRGARIRPHTKDGKVDGFKLYAIRPSSLYAKLGLMNGDTLHSINGMEIDSLDKGLELYAKLRSSASLSVNVTRRGKPVTLDYTIK